MSITVEGHDAWATCRGGRLHVSMHGKSAADAPPLLLLHGFTGASGVWAPMLPALGAQRRVILIDLLGHGRSDKPDAGYDIPSQANAAFAAMDHFSVERCHVVAHSAGGDVAVAMHERDPRRVASVCLLGTAPDVAFVNMDPVAQLLRVPLLGPLLWAASSEKAIRQGLRKTFAPGFAGVPDVYVSSLRQMTHNAYRQGIQALEAFKNEKDLCRRMVGRMPRPFVIFGAEDQWVDPAAAKSWSDVAGARVAFLPKTGHTPMAEAPAETAALILEHLATSED